MMRMVGSRSRVDVATGVATTTITLERAAEGGLKVGANRVA
jgi:molybdopterin-binding protein